MSALTYPDAEWPIALFHRACASVPAYHRLMQERGVSPARIQTLSDYSELPAVSKKTYLEKAAIQDLMWDGDSGVGSFVSTSSGSSGEPFAWFRDETSERESAQLFGSIFGDIFTSRQKKTLLIVGFAMGNWIGGTYTMQAALELRRQGHQLVTVTPGLSKEEILHALSLISPAFEQTILAAYPPFAKDVIDDAVHHGIDLRARKLRLVFAGENFSEAWRSYLMERIGDETGFSCMSIYGTADAGIMGHETPFSVFVRRQATSNLDFHQTLFPNASVTPTLVQYDPSLRYVEEKDGRLLFTVNNAMPLLRYDILDEGRVMPSSLVLEALDSAQIEIPTELMPWAEKPFIALYGRVDVATTFYALNVYPENIKAGLEQPALASRLTGKFIVQTIFSEAQEPALHVKVEMQRGVESSPSLEDEVRFHTWTSLQATNGEFRRLAQEIGDRAMPVVHLLAYESPEFRIRIKHRWSAKENRD